MKRFACLMAAATLLVTGPANADAKTAVVVPPAAEPGIPPAMISRALEALRGCLELAGEHFIVITSGQAIELAEADNADKFDKPKMEGDAAKCTSADCAIWFRRVVNADLAAQLSIRSKVDENKRLRPDTVTIVLLEDAEARWSAAAPIVNGAVEAAVLQAFDEVLSKRSKGVGPWVTVQGTPEGATVQIDEALVGRIPLLHQRVENASSVHVLTVQAAGFQEFRDTLDFGGDVSRERVVEVNLEPTGTPGAANQAATRSRSDRNTRLKIIDYGIAGALGAFGGVNIGFGARNLAKNGDCAQHSGGQCVERYGDQHSVTTSWITVGAGIAAVVAATAVAIWTPVYRLSAKTTPHTALVSVERSF